MATTLTLGATTVTLADDLLWENEFAWSPVKAEHSYSAAGALIIDRGVKLAGRPMTLSGSAKHGWIERSVALTLLTWAAIPGAEMTLLYRGVSYVVQFDQTGDSPLVVTPVVDYSDPAPEDYCFAVLKFIVTG